eukprot:3163935-Ditylum_brightwellii.AAC.1
MDLRGLDLTQSPVYHEVLLGTSIPNPVKQHINGLGLSLGWEMGLTISIRAWQSSSPFLVFTNRGPLVASAANADTSLRTSHTLCIGMFGGTSWAGSLLGSSGDVLRKSIPQLCC